MCYYNVHVSKNRGMFPHFQEYHWKLLDRIVNDLCFLLDSVFYIFNGVYIPNLKIAILRF